MTRLVVVALVVAMSGSVAVAGKPAAPKKPEIVAQLVAKGAKGASVSKILGEISPGRWVVLYAVRDKKKHGVTLSVATVTRDATTAAISIDGTLALPTKVAPSEEVEQAKWGTSDLKDRDGDGKLELFVIYGYNSAMQAAVGDIYYREWALVNVDGAPTLSLHVTLDERPQASVFEEIASSWKFGKIVAGTPPELVVTSKIGEYDDAAGARTERTEKATYRWDAAKDVWVLVKKPTR